MTIDVALAILGWAGSVLLVVSLLQSRMLTLRILNLIAAVLLTAYTAALAVWPSVAMNAAVALINTYYIAAPRLRRIRPVVPGSAMKGDVKEIGTRDPVHPAN
ncbi:hypothetical protein [Leifsonia sp. 2MCAF36]|uniref:hypothetical protein n=1 Tax=Leifsonia sp. 2MCAF36 TaxID=3232988 RepID=UPI003F9871F2